MSTAFYRTLHSLHAGGSGRPIVGVVAAVLLAGAWASWSVLAHVTLYEISTTARLGLDQAVTPIQAPLAGEL